MAFQSNIAFRVSFPISHKVIPRFQGQTSQNLPNDTYTLSAFSIIPKSMDTLGHAGKFSSINAFSLSVA